MNGSADFTPAEVPPRHRGARIVLWAVIVIASAGAWAELVSGGRAGDAVMLLAVFILVVTLAAAIAWAALDIRAARSTRALIGRGVRGLAPGAMRRMVATTVLAVVAAVGLFANCGSGSAQTASGPLANQYGSDPGGFWAVTPLILALLVAGIAAPAVITFGAAALIRAGSIRPNPRVISIVQLAVLVGILPLLAAYLVASVQTPTRCSLAMGHCAAGAGGTFVAVVSLAWFPVLYFLAGTLLAAASHDLTKEEVA